jgi:hypothetical protein
MVFLGPPSNRKSGNTASGMHNTDPNSYVSTGWPCLPLPCASIDSLHIALQRSKANYTLSPREKQKVVAMQSMLGVRVRMAAGKAARKATTTLSRANRHSLTSSVSSLHPYGAFCSAAVLPAFVYMDPLLTASPSFAERQAELNTRILERERAALSSFQVRLVSCRLRASMVPCICGHHDAMPWQTV